MKWRIVGVSVGRGAILSAASLMILSSTTTILAAATFNTVMVGGRPDGDPLGPQIAPGVGFAVVDQFYLNEAGQVAFQATLQGSGVSTANDRGIWRWSAGNKSLLAREAS